MNRNRNTTWIKHILEWVLTAIITALVSIGLAVLLLEWVAGCGESYTDATGKTHLNQCLFINLPPATTN